MSAATQLGNVRGFRHGGASYVLLRCLGDEKKPSGSGSPEGLDLPIFIQGGKE